MGVGIQSMLERWYKRRVYRVKILEDGFEYRRKKYKTLTTIAKAISGNSTSGFEFFGLTIPWEQRASRLQGRRINESTLITLCQTTEF